jgi:molybdopterin converting factor small subunit
VNIFVNDSNIRFLNGLDSPVPQGSRILIVAALSGG